MSYTELHFGKVKKLAEITIPELKQFLENHPELEDDDDMDDLEDRFEDKWVITLKDKNKKYKEPLYMPYFVHNKVLYQMVEHSGELEDIDLDITKVNSDGTIDFAYQFYNGGTCFTEMLAEGLERLNKK